MEFNLRNYQGEQDYQRMREFLREVFLSNGRRTLSWAVTRLDYWRWHGIYNLAQASLEKDVFIWETTGGQIGAVLNCEEPGQAFLQVRPEYKNADLEDQMISEAEAHLRAPSRRGGTVLWLWTDAGDRPRIEILKRRGFIHKDAYDEHQWRRSLDLPIPDVAVRPGYTIRPLGDEAELPTRSWASWRAFHPDELDEKYEGWNWYLNIQSAPLYRPDLDLVAIAPSGDVAAFTTIWYDEVTQSGMFEPVGCVPEHQRKGLARALMFEGMRRLRSLGASMCMVGGGSVHANSLYQAVMDPVFDICQPWEKRWAE